MFEQVLLDCDWCGMLRVARPFISDGPCLIINTIHSSTVLGELYNIRAKSRSDYVYRSRSMRPSSRK